MDDKDDAAFDPTRLLDGWKPAQPPAAPELDLGTLGLGRSQAAQLDSERIAQLKKRGFEMTDIEDVEVSEIRMPVVEAPLEVDLAGVDAVMSAAAGFAQRFDQSTGFADLDLSVHPERHAPNPRLLARWQPGAWIAVRRRALGASTEFLNTPDGPLVESRPPQWLMAAWPPQQLDDPVLGRWPELAMLGAAQEPDAAGELLLATLPDQALLWIAELDVDWALLAELVLHQDPGLKPFQVKALRELAEVERLASFEKLNSAYQAAADGRPLRRKK